MYSLLVSRELLLLEYMYLLCFYLSFYRQLRSQGASLPSAVCAAHLDAGEGGRQWPVLRLCCYGPVSAAVTTTNGTPIVLTSTALNTPPVSTHIIIFFS